MQAAGIRSAWILWHADPGIVWVACNQSEQDASQDEEKQTRFTSWLALRPQNSETADQLAFVRTDIVKQSCEPLFRRQIVFQALHKRVVP